MPTCRAATARPTCTLSASRSDGSSISLLEAMACGCPRWFPDIPGNREWVTPGENGWLFPLDNAEALAAAILNAIEQRDRLAEMGCAARRTAESAPTGTKTSPCCWTLISLH